jgi:hypothetical protein
MFSKRAYPSYMAPGNALKLRGQRKQSNVSERLEAGKPKFVNDTLYS